MPKLALQPVNTDDEVVMVQQLADLTQIFDENVQLCILQRPQERGLQNYLAVAENFLDTGIRQSFGRDSPFPPELLPDLPGRQYLVDDIQFMMQIYSELLDCDMIALRLMVLQKAMCPRFHVDHTGVRLLCTWQGPGTQWLRSDSADRSKLGEGAQGKMDAESGLIRDPLGIGEVPTGAIALLKGQAWENHADKGIIHRSPELGDFGGLRIALSLDTL